MQCKQCAVRAGAVTDDIIDRLNRNMARFNEMFEEAGTPKRVQFGLLEVIPDGSPDPIVDQSLFAIFPFRFRAGEGNSVRAVPRRRWRTDAL